MRTFRKLAATLVALSVAVSAFSLSVSALDAEETDLVAVSDTIPNIGGWTFSSIGAYNLTSEEKGILDSAMTQLDGIGSYDGVAVMATHTDTGTDYAFLCIASAAVPDAEPYWAVVSAYADLEGYVGLSHIQNIDPEALSLMDNPPEITDDSWTVSTGREPADTFPSAVVSALNDHMGVGLEPMAVLATQTVAGKNYRCLAYGTLVTAQPASYVYAVDVYEDTDGNASITDIGVLDLYDYTVMNRDLENDDSGSDEPVAGGWEFSAECIPNISETEQKILDDATVGISGSKIIPVDVIASQTVAGKNLAYLCVVEPVVPDPVPHWAIVTVYAGFDNTAQLVGIKDIDPADVATLDNIPESGLSGGWYTEKEDVERELSGELADALAGMEGVSYDPIAVLGTQTVAGTNYRILAYGTLVTADPVTSLYVIDVYKDLNREVEITDIKPFDLSAYISYAQIEPDDSSEDDSEEESQEESKPDSQADTNPNTGAFAMGIGAAALAAAAVAVARKKK